MSIKKTTNQPKPLPTYAITQCGGVATFLVPPAAMLYNTGMVSIAKQDRIDDTMDKISELFESHILN